MNISELARKLKISTQELKDILPELGFDIGQRAIKVDDVVANKILSNWSTFKKELEKKRQAEKREILKEDHQVNINENKEAIVRIPQVITVREFASRLNLPVTTVIRELMKDGILATLNERIDYETAAIVAEDFGFKVEKEEKNIDEKEFVGDKIKELLDQEEKSKLKPRPPVIVVMGHVDHGKTKLLDAIRKTHVMESEAGGITQHIGAYQAIYKDRLITFIDTPGHEAFTAMRSRGAKIADIAILVVAADDGVQPQTKEAIKIIEAAKIPFVVAINKMDKPEANPEKVKQELAALNLIPEEWGGKTICVPISAKACQGIDDLLEMILLVADLEKDKIVANPERLAVGTIIESHLDKNEGAVATILVQAGTLRKNDNLIIGKNFYGRVRAMKDFKGDSVEEALPGTPVKILGFKAVPRVGDIVEVTDNLKECNKKVKIIKTVSHIQDDYVAAKTTNSENQEQVQKKLKIILKADVLGSLEAIFVSLEKFNHPEVGIEIVASGLGNISEAEILRAEAVGAIIFGFNVLVTPKAEELAREKKVEIKIFNVIYDLLDEIKNNLEKLLEPEIVRTDLGKVQVLAIFRTEPNSMIVGGRVQEGRVVLGSDSNQTYLKVLRNREEISNGLLMELQSAKTNVLEVCAGQECGMKIKGKPVIRVGDILEFYREEKRIRKLE